MIRIFLVKLTAIIGLSLLYSQAANADDWGCQVLLCLSDPRGPTTETECVPPIKKLWRELSKGNAFPSCLQAGSASEGKGSFVRQVNDYFDLCPPDTNPAPVNSYAVQGTLVEGGKGNAWGFGKRFNITGTVGQSEAVRSENSRRPSPRACVGKTLGSYQTGSYEDRTTIVVYDRVVWMKPQSSRAVDVYIDGKIHQRTHW